MKRYSFIVPVISAFVLTSSSYAAQMHVTNENGKAIDIKIEADGDSNAVSKHQIPADRVSSFEVTSKHLNGKSHFFIKGDTSAFTPGGKCDHLSVDKDYKITFLNDKMGTTCLAEESSEPDTSKKAD